MLSYDPWYHSGVDFADQNAFHCFVPHTVSRLLQLISLPFRQKAGLEYSLPIPDFNLGLTWKIPRVVVKT